MCISVTHFEMMLWRVITHVIIAHGAYTASVCVYRSYPEVVTGVFFILMTLLWFTREPGFVPGWTSLFEKYVSVALQHATAKQGLLGSQIMHYAFILSCVMLFVFCLLEKATEPMQPCLSF